jgi:oligopeptide transport system substrate-binding protein
MQHFFRIFFTGIALSTLCTACFPEKPPIDNRTSVRISTDSEPHTFDPRLVRDLSDTTFIQMFYEGLMRHEKGEKLVPAMAESYTISPDKKTYNFQIRKSLWSDGQPVTAYDFEETWKSVLDPDFPAPNAYQLYVIKGAKAAREGQIPLSEVGIHAIDDQTLIVELEKPTSYFLHLTSTYFLYPASRSMRNKDPSPSLITNGPFQLQASEKMLDEWSAVPNPYYWDRESVKLDQLKLIKLDNSTALKLFDQNELEWAGSPLSTIPIDTLAALKQKGNLGIHPAAGVYFVRVNTEQAPLNNPKMRRAFALALNRSDLVEHILQGNQLPAKGYLPPSFSAGKDLFDDNSVEQAQALFKEGLTEMQLKAESLPTITVCYSSNPRGHKIAQVIQQQWKSAFGVDIQLLSCEHKVFYDRLKNHDYQLGIGSWFADIDDPISFLEVFKFKNNGTNNTQWENQRYIELIDQSSETIKDKARQKLLLQAEEVLIEEMPIIPLFFATYNYLQSPQLKGVYFSELGYLDFKNAYLELDLLQKNK